MSKFRRVPAPFIQTVNEQGEIVDVKPPTSDLSTFYWMYRLFADVEDELRPKAAQQATNWPPILKPREEE